MLQTFSGFSFLDGRNIEKRLLIVGLVESFYLGLRLPRDIFSSSSLYCDGII